MITNLRDKLNKISASPVKQIRKKFDISNEIGGEIIEYANGGFIIKRSIYEIGLKYGDFQIDNIEECYTFDKHLLFLDTETTGLGAASCPFLIGIAYYKDNMLYLEQIFMRDLDDEEAALCYLIDKFSDMCIVSFNGKSFDIPLIKDRCVVNSIRTSNFALMQIDLLHLSRRIWKKRLPSCRLGTIEEEILKFQRNHDIAGSEVPELYKKYLTTGIADDIIKIIEHNESDVVSMVVLLWKLLKIENDPITELDNIFDVMHLGEFYYNRKQFDRAKKCLEAVIHTKTDSITLYTAMKYLSLISKSENDWENALFYWNKMIIVNTNAIFPLEELAKYYEHKEKNISEALKYAKRARLYALRIKDSTMCVELDKRILRLNQKLCKNSNSDREIDLWV